MYWGLLVTIAIQVPAVPREARVVLEKLRRIGATVADRARAGAYGDTVNVHAGSAEEPDSVVPGYRD